MALFWQAVVWLCMGMLGYTYLGYPLLMYLLAKLRRLRQQPAPAATLPDTNHQDWPLVSFLIPAYNEQSIIRQKVENTLNLDYPKDRLHITVVSDGSTDQTNDMLASYGPNEIQFISLPKRQGKTTVLNQTIPRLPGEIIALSDASGLLRPDALKKLVRHFANPQVGCVSGVYMFETEDNTLRSMTERLYWQYETFLKKHESQVHSVIGAHGALYAFRRALFQPLDQKVINDDFILPMQIIRQGYRVLYEPDAVVSERESTSLNGEFQRRIRINVGNFQMIYVLRSLLNPRRGRVALQFISHKVLRTISPVFILLLPVACLLAEAPLYRFMLDLQAAFYLIGVLGYLQEFFGLRISYLYMPFYFLMGNVAAIFGFVRFILKKQSILWRRV